MKPTREPGYWNPYLAGAVLGTVLFASFAMTGSGLGASGGLARIVAAVADAVAPGHVDRTPGLARLAGGAKDALANRLVPLVAGVAIGGFLSALLAGRLRGETRRGPRLASAGARWAFALAGGAIAGFGAQLARGCTSGQALSGGATLALGSWAFMAAVFAAGYLLAAPLRRLWT